MTKQTNEVAATQLSAAVKVAVAPITYHFKAFAADKDGYKKLEALVAAEKLTMDDIEVTAATADAPLKWKRKSVTVEAPLPVLTIEGLTAAQNKHIEFLIAKQETRCACSAHRVSYC